MPITINMYYANLKLVEASVWPHTVSVAMVGLSLTHADAENTYPAAHSLGTWSAASVLNGIAISNITCWLLVRPANAPDFELGQASPRFTQDSLRQPGFAPTVFNFKRFSVSEYPDCHSFTFKLVRVRKTSRNATWREQ